MRVHIDKARADHASARIERSARAHLHRGRYLCDSPVADEQIRAPAGASGTIQDRAVVDHQVNHLSPCSLSPGRPLSPA